MIEKSKIDIIEIISKYIDIKKIGNTYAAKCPFHPTNTFDAFRINPNKQIYRCFNCMNHSGDVIDFVMKIENVDFKRACEILNLSNYNPLKKENKKKIPPQIIKDQSILSTAVNYFKHHLNESSVAKDYLNSRKIKDKRLIEELNIGYAPKYGLAKYLENCGHSKENAIKEGLIKENQNGLYDFFRDRIIFPIYDTNKNIITITSRTLDNKTKVKHLHLPGEIGSFYNEKAIKKNSVIIVEGIFDCLSLLQEGFNSAAIYGTNGLTDRLLLKLRKYSPTVYIAFDKDNNKAGEKGAATTSQKLNQHKINNYTIYLPITNGNKTDINDLFSKEDFTKEDFISLIESSKRN